MNNVVSPDSQGDCLKRLVEERFPGAAVGLGPVDEDGAQTIFFVRLPAVVDFVRLELEINTTEKPSGT